MEPMEQGARNVSLDVLRALALFGVLMVNLLTAFRVSLFAQFLGPATGSRLDQTIDRFVAVAIEMKSWIVFSLLFGIGLGIQLERAARRTGTSFARHVTRRLGALLVIGLLHLVLIWNGDVLTEYTLAGLLFVPLLRLSTRALVAVALALFVVYVVPLPWPEPFPTTPALVAHIAAANRAYGHGSFAEVLAFRIHELRPILVLELWALPRTVGLFALGAAAWRAGLFAGGPAHRRLLLATAAAGIGLGGAVTLVSAGVIGNGLSWLGAWESTIDRLAALGFALGYVAAFLLLFRLRLARRLLAPFALLGRMALTAYLTQSLILGWIFYGYGLGRFATMAVAPAALLGLLLYATQVALCTLWLRAFHFGPVEWLWRSVTYRAWPPMVRRDR